MCIEMVRSIIYIIKKRRNLSVTKRFVQLPTTTNNLHNLKCESESRVQTAVIN